MFDPEGDGRRVAVSCSAGLIEGIEKDGIARFLGIPYAEPPVGQRRWAGPERKARFAHTFVADRFGPACIQNPPQLSKTYTLAADIAQSEDCLTLNIWAPESERDLPVMVWIHGGSFAIGSSSEGMYDGAALAQRGIVVVTLNYRLGIFGWFAHPELSAEQEGVSGNYGLRDQICVLEWVRDNIAGFGGDPGNVTVAGQSAGALSAVYLMVSPLARGLFHKVIAQSPYLISTPALKTSVHGLSSAEDSGRALHDFIETPDIASLRKRDARELSQLAMKAGFTPSGTIDGKLLPDQLVAILERGEQAPIPVLTGYTKGELRTLRALAPAVSIRSDDYESMIAERYDDLAAEFLRLYPAKDLEGSILAATRDAMYGWSAMTLARAQHRLGEPAYLYRWDHDCGLDDPSLPAFHGSEVPYVFGTLDATGPCWPKCADRGAEYEMSTLMMQSWSQFVRQARPVPPLGSAWPAIRGHDCYVRLDRGSNCEAGPPCDGFAVHDVVIRRRREQGTTPWNWNVGIAAPPRTSIDPKR